MNITLELLEDKGVCDEGKAAFLKYYPAGKGEYQEILDKCESFVNLPDELNRYMDELWVDIRASGSSSVIELIFLFAVILGLGGALIIYLRRRNR